MSENEFTRAENASDPAAPPYALIGAGLGLLSVATTVAVIRQKRRDDHPVIDAVYLARRAGPMPFGLRGKWAINALIRVIENDKSRQALLVVLRNMAKRA